MRKLNQLGSVKDSKKFITELGKTNFGTAMVLLLFMILNKILLLKQIKDLERNILGREFILLH